MSGIADVSFTPRWRKGTDPIKVCYISDSDCKDAEIKVTKSVNVQELEHFFNKGNDDVSEGGTVTEDIPLCSYHYGKWYRHINVPHTSTCTNCKTCGKRLRDYNKSRSVPEPELLQHFLNTNTEFKDTFHPNDRVCYACYKSHLSIVKHIKNLAISTDADLKDLLLSIKQSLPRLSEMKSWDDAVDYTVGSLAVTVGEALLKQTAVLLPQVYVTFKSELDSVIRQCEVNTEGQDIPTSTWLRSSLSSLLKHHMAYKCTIPKYGTLIYRYGGDLIHALTVALGQGHQSNMHSSEKDAMLTQVCQNINSKLHTQVNKLIKSDSVQPHKIEQFDVDEFVDDLDPTIWKAVCLLTQSSNKKLNYVRKIRTVFTLCQIFFTMNRQCSFPLHTLIADAIEVCGGSIRLKTLLNRLGVCASTETHARYIQYRVEIRQREGPLAGHMLDCPIIVSADNLDYQQSYSRVYSGNQSISWHGTTVQITLSNSQRPTPMETGADIPQPTCRNDPISSSNTSLVKRTYSTLSPCKTPIINSPKPKKARRRRTGAETTPSQLAPETAVISTPQTAPQLQLSDRPTMSIEQFELQQEEKKSLDKLGDMCQQYIVLKLANALSQNSIVGIQMYYCLSQNVPPPDKTSIIYFKVLDEKCDNKETLLSIINDLYVEFILSGKKTHVILEGDQATYERLHSIRLEYGNESKWLVLFPGDWHFLKNYQEVLLKIYFEAGLSDLARASGYLPRSVGTNFKRTHRFLLESWEALYRVLMKYFLAKQAPSDFLQCVSSLLQNFPQSANQENAHRNLNEMIDTIEEVYAFRNFESYMNSEAKQNPTLKFWLQFLLKDCLAYLALYLAMRSGNWVLRMAALKQMGPLFTAYDRQKYSKLIPLHIQEMFSLPTDILAHLQEGKFTVSILGRACHSIGIDEGHEMCINKDCKEYITRPSAENMSRMAAFLPVRAKALKNLESQIFADSKAKKPETEVTSLHSKDPECKKHEANVNAQVHKINTDSKVLPTHQAQSTCTTLCHTFNTQSIRPEQANDLLNFREIGLDTQKQYINYFILRTPSVKPPKRRKSLLTFTERRTRQKKGSQLERERKLQLEVWKKRVSFAVTTGFKDNMSYQQCIELPRAIATVDGKPIKGAKANTTKVYEKRYAHATPPIITTSLTAGWSPDSVITEGMFLINITPWSSHKTMGDYATFLLRQHILPHFRNGSTTEVHLLFDNPSCQQYSPKYFERLHRDERNQVPDDHSCCGFSADMVLPPKWRQNVINCRQCKRELVCFLSEYFLQKIRYRLKHTQRFVTAGGLQGDLAEKAMYVTNQTQATIDERLTSNAEESDTRIWLHVLHSAGTKKLVLSPDTDVYHIGMTVIAETDLDVIVRLSPFSSIEQRLLHLPALLTSFKNDPDLAAVQERKIAQTIQTLFVTTGCDYISFFNGLGKATFLQTLFAHSEFITSDTSSAPGTLTDEANGFLSFLRLVGCAYFNKHKSAFLPSFPSPVTLFNSVQTVGDHHQQHNQWLDLIRDRVWPRIQFEEDIIPSSDALFRHWRRSCWVSSVWRQAASNHIVYPQLEDFGWRKPDSNTLVIDWDSEANLSKIKERVALIRKGCSCKTGCSSARCKCKKHNSHCGPGCKCTGCTNLPAEALATAQEETSDSESEASSSNCSGELLNLEVNQLMFDVFGENEGNDLHSMEVTEDSF